MMLSHTFSTSHPTYVLSLELIHLHDFRYSSTSTEDRLTRVLKQRSTSRSPIHKVEIIDWSVAKEWLDELRIIVPIVRWREQTRSDPTEY